ncbi:MAG: hypothetical protein AAFR52_09530 [Pseudomonadota bacterium]
MINRTALNLLLVVVCLGLGLAGWQRLSASPAPIALPAPPAAAEAREVFVERPAAGSFAEIARRPLFEPGRRPVRAASAPAAAPAPPPEVQLIGLVDSGSGRRALVRLAGEGSRLVAEGALIEGWSVERLAEDALTLARGSRRIVVALGEGDVAGAAPRGQGGRATRPNTRPGVVPRPTPIFRGGFNVDDED